MKPTNQEQDVSLFTSNREIRLWLWALVVIVGIFSTLGLAEPLVAFLRARDLLRASFAVVVILLGIGLVIPWLGKRPGRDEIAVALGVALAYWLSFIRLENPAERTHLIEYGVVAAFIYAALQERARNGRIVPRPAFISVAATAILGLIDEIIQAVLPNRVFDWQDVFFNAFAGFLIVVARLALAPVRRPGWRLWFLWTVAAAFALGWSMDPSLFGAPRPVVVAPWWNGSPLARVDVPHFANVAAGGLFVGLCQWLILRAYLARAARWALACLAAVAAAGVIMAGMGRFGPDAGWLAGVALYGTLAGLGQWAVLRSTIPRAGWWVGASSVAWLLAIPAGDLSGPPGWAYYGAISGAALVWLLRQGAADALIAASHSD